MDGGRVMRDRIVTTWGLASILSVFLFAACEQEFAITKVRKSGSEPMHNVDLGGTMAPPNVVMPQPDPQVSASPIRVLGDNTGSGTTDPGSSHNTGSTNTGSTNTGFHSGNKCLFRDDDSDGKAEFVCDDDDDDDVDSSKVSVDGHIIVNVKDVELVVKYPGENQAVKLIVAKDLGQVDLMNLPQTILGKASLPVGTLVMEADLELFTTGNEVREGGKVTCEMKVPGNQFQLKFDDFMAVKATQYSLQLSREEAKVHQVLDGCLIRPEGKAVVISSLIR